METTFDFEELQLPEFGEGALFYGQATLVDNCGETDTFLIKDIQLGGKWLPRPPYEGGGTLGQQVFKCIADVLYNENTAMGRCAALEWGDFVSGEIEPVPMFRRRAGLLVLKESLHA